MKTNLLVLLAWACAVLARGQATAADADAGGAAWPSVSAEAPFITNIRIFQTEVEIVVRIPSGLGIKKVTLEGRSRLGAGTWRPRAVERLSGVGAGNVPPCLSADLHHADGAIERGLWLPLADYGVALIKSGTGP